MFSYKMQLNHINVKNNIFLHKCYNQLAILQPTQISIIKVKVNYKIVCYYCDILLLQYNHCVQDVM